MTRYLQEHGHLDAVGPSLQDTGHFEAGAGSVQTPHEMLCLAMESAGLGWWTWQAEDDRIRWGNERAGDLLGFSRAEASAFMTTAQLASAFLGSPGSEAFRQAFANAARSGTRLFHQACFHCPDGVSRWLEWKSQPGPGSDASWPRLVGTLCDITERKQAETVTQASQHFLRAVLDSLSGHVAVLDETGTILAVNEAWLRYGLGNQALAARIGPGANYFQSSDESSASVQGIRDVMAGRRTHFELVYACDLPTQPRWFVMRVTRFADSGPVRVLVVHDDCTEQKQPEQALRLSQARYRSLFNSMQEGFCVVELVFDSKAQPVDFIFLEVNDAFAKQTGVKVVAGGRLRDVHPSMAQGLLRLCGQVVQTGCTVRQIYEETNGLQSLWFDIHVARVDGPDSGRVAVVFNNVTQSIKSNEALRLNEHRFRALFDQGPVAMYSCDAAGVIQDFNASAEKLWGFTPAKGDDRRRLCSAVKMFHTDGAALNPELTPMARVLQGEIAKVTEEELVIERPDGVRITVRCNVVPLKNRHGEITGAIKSFYDTTLRSHLERKTQEQAQALAELHRRKDEFLAMLSHELRNPLAPLDHAVQLLRQQQGDAPQHGALDIIERQAGQLKHLVDDLLEISRITSGNIRLRKVPVSLQQVVLAAVETTRPLMLQCRHTLDVSLGAQPLWLMADPVRLEQVLVNLLNNAAKYTDPGGHVWISAKLQAHVPGVAPVALIQVRDNGVGIPADLLPQVFDLFTQAERSIDRSQGGLGVGLSLVRQLVQLHDGSVEVSSLPGQGSEFVVRLPAMASAPVPLAAPTSTPALPVPQARPAPPAGVALPPPSASHCRVLAVDDNHDAVNSLATLLRLSGYEVQTVYDGPGVLPAALAMQPDVVLLDIGLPGLTGYEVAKQLRQQESLQHTVLVALTGYGRESDRQRAREAGFDHHLTKPAGWGEVEKILQLVTRELAAQAQPAPGG